MTRSTAVNWLASDIVDDADAGEPPWGGHPGSLDIQQFQLVHHRRHRLDWLLVDLEQRNRPEPPVPAPTRPPRDLQRDQFMERPSSDPLEGDHCSEQRRQERPGEQPKEDADEGQAAPDSEHDDL